MSSKLKAGSSKEQIYFDLMDFCLGEEGLKTPGDWLDHSFFENRVKMRGVESIADFRLFRGSLPPVSFLKKHSHVADWWRGYTRTYLERDLRDVSQVTSLSDFRRVMALLAASSGQILNQTNIARAAAISQATVGRYIGLLEITGLFVRLFPYSKNVRQRMVKSPKIYCLDTGLACSLAGIGPGDELPGEFRGSSSKPWPFRISLCVPRWMAAGSFIFGNSEALSGKWILWSNVAAASSPSRSRRQRAPASRMRRTCSP